MLRCPSPKLNCTSTSKAPWSPSWPSRSPPATASTLPYADTEDAAQGVPLRRPPVVPEPVLRAHGRAAHGAGLRRPRRRLSRPRRRTGRTARGDLLRPAGAHRPGRADGDGRRGTVAGAGPQRGDPRRLHPADHVLPARPVRRVGPADPGGRTPHLDRIIGIGLDSAEVGHPPVEVPRGVRGRRRARAAPGRARRGGGAARVHHRGPGRARRRARSTTGCAAWRTPSSSNGWSATGCR